MYEFPPPLSILLEKQNMQDSIMLLGLLRQQQVQRYCRGSCGLFYCFIQSMGQSIIGQDTEPPRFTLCVSLGVW